MEDFGDIYKIKDTVRTKFPSYPCYFFILVMKNKNKRCNVLLDLYNGFNFIL